MKKSNKKRGFTLVELIVVLVILAILAALLIPALTGYIDKARKSQVIAETRMLHTAIQTEMSELYATSEWPKSSNGLTGLNYIAGKNKSKNITDAAVARYAEIAKLSEVPSLQDGGAGRFGAYVTPDGKVAVITYYDGAEHVGLYIGETQEYMAFDKSEAPSYEGYLLGDTIQVTSKNDSAGDKIELNPLLRKKLILHMIGYTDSYYD